MLDATTTVATPWWGRTLVWLLLPTAGAGAGWLLDRGADYAVRMPWPVLRGPIRLLADLPEPQATIGVLALGAVVGLVLAFFVDAESLTVRVSRTEVVLRRPGATRAVPRADVAVGFRDRDRLVLLGRTGRELAVVPAHLAPRRLSAAFAAHGIGWSDGDPYAGAYRRWVPDHPDVPPAAHAVFAARQRALDSGDDGDAADLRDELARLGFVVRDERRKQHWRRVDG